MSAIHAMNSNSNSPTDPLRHNLKVNGIISQNNSKSTMVYSPLALANNTTVNNNNTHITNNNSNADNLSGQFYRSFCMQMKIVLHKIIAHYEWKRSDEMEIKRDFCAKLFFIIKDQFFM